VAKQANTVAPVAETAIPAGSTGEPTVIVDGLHVVYRVYGAGGDRGTASTALFRIIGFGTDPVGLAGRTVVLSPARSTRHAFTAFYLPCY